MELEQIVSPKLPEILTVFDDVPGALFSKECLHDLILRLLPPDFFYEIEEMSQEVFVDRLHLCLPSIRWTEGLKFSLYLLCRHQTNVVKFFYEMMDRWLLPGEKLSISSFFSVNFRFDPFLKNVFTLCEMVISVDNAQDLEVMRRQLNILEPEIRLGLTSVYHAKRILQIKGLSVDEKTSFIQERISSLVKRRPFDFDHDIFPQMHHFLIMCSDEFKTMREDSHLSQIICAFYLFRRSLALHMEKFPGNRFVFVKLRRAILHLPFGEKKILGMCVGLNFQSEHELFDQRHLTKVLQNQFSELAIIGDSFFCDRFNQERIQLLYLEVAKKDGSNFSLAEVKGLKEKLPSQLQNGIEKIVHPLFMPRNEEEVMRNIITLSRQLKFSRDLPQAILSFDEQTESELCFTVVWVRVLKPEDVSIEEIFQRSTCLLKFVPDRVKHVGLIRKKFPKEASVFRMKIPNASFLRSDHSVDLFKARHFLVCELQNILGEFRDYNGGMIAKQHEQYIALKKRVREVNRRDEMLLESFFHSIYPIELRSLFPLEPLEKLFTMLVEGIESQKVRTEIDSEYAFFLLPYSSKERKEQIFSAMQTFQVPSSHLLTLDLSYFDSLFLGGIYREDQLKLKERWVNTVLES